MTNEPRRDKPSGTWRCRKCHDEIAPNASRCPACGFDPIREHRGAYRTHKWLTVLGFVTFVGLVWVPFTWHAGSKHRKEMRTPVAEFVLDDGTVEFP